MGGCNDLNSVVAYIADGGNKSNIWNTVNKLISAPTVYYLWNERNKRMFQDTKRTEEEVIVVIIKYMEDALQSLRVKKSIVVKLVAEIWNLKWEKDKLVPVIDM